MKKIISLMITLLVVVSACHKEAEEEQRQEPKITYVKYVSRQTVDNQLWLNLIVTVDSEGLEIKDAGFLMGNVSDEDNLHHQFLPSSVTIVSNCEVQGNTVKYDGVAKKYHGGYADKTTYIKPYFVFEDGTEVYGKSVWLYDGREVEEEY